MVIKNWVPQVSLGSGLYLKPYQGLLVLSFMTHYHLVSGPSPYSCFSEVRSLDADCRFQIKIMIFIQLIFTIPLVFLQSHSNTFVIELGTTDFTGFPNNLIMLPLISIKDQRVILKIDLHCFPFMVYLPTIKAAPCWRQDELHISIKIRIIWTNSHNI